MVNISDKTLLTIISVFTLVAICSTAYIFLVQKEYDFVIESPCDPSTDTCFYRDCTVEECPPNGLEYYRIFSLSARDFATCADSSCLPECSTGAVACVETLCGESEEDVCAQ
jgi:hypothetical protein